MTRVAVRSHEFGSRSFIDASGVYVRSARRRADVQRSRPERTTPSPPSIVPAGRRTRSTACGSRAAPKTSIAGGFARGATARPSTSSLRPRRARSRCPRRTRSRDARDTNRASTHLGATRAERVAVGRVLLQRAAAASIGSCPTYVRSPPSRCGDGTCVIAIQPAGLIAPAVTTARPAVHVQRLPQQLLAQRRRASEQILREPAVFEHFVINARVLVLVQAHAGKILQPQVAVTIDLGVGQPWPQISRLSAIGRRAATPRAPS